MAALSNSYSLFQESYGASWDGSEMLLELSDSDTSNAGDIENIQIGGLNSSKTPIDLMRTSTPKSKTSKKRITQTSSDKGLNRSAPVPMEAVRLTEASDESESEQNQQFQVLAFMERIEKKVDRLSKEMVYVRNLVEKGQKDMSIMFDKSKQSVKRKVEVPSHIKSAIHDGYRSGRTEKNLKWVTKSGDQIVKTKSEENTPMTNYIKTFVKGLYPEAENGVIEAGTETYFNSIKQREHQERQGKLASHKTKMVKYSRKQRKLAWRKQAVQNKNGWEEAKKRKVMDSLQMTFMSSEEEVSSDEETVFQITPLAWRSEMYNKLMQELDLKFEKLKSVRGKRQSVKRVQGSVPSNRKKPTVDSKHEWVLS